MEVADRLLSADHSQRNTHGKSEHAVPTTQDTREREECLRDFAIRKAREYTRWGILIVTIGGLGLAIRVRQAALDGAREEQLIQDHRTEVLDIHVKRVQQRLFLEENSRIRGEYVKSSD